MVFAFFYVAILVFHQFIVYAIFSSIKVDHITEHQKFRLILAKSIRLLKDWPPQSPDLSPIKNMWDIVKENVKFYYAKSLDELWDVLKDEWNEIPNSTIKFFIIHCQNEFRQLLHQRAFRSSTEV